MNRLNRTLILGGAAGALVLGTLVPTASSAVRETWRSDTAAETGAADAAKPARKGYKGHCKRKHRKGVTVVVDFRKLKSFGKHNGKKIVRCSPPKFKKNGKLKKRTGIQALRGAGIKVAGTSQSGLAFVCRVDGRPARTEPLAVDGSPGYQEGCVRTPPTSAYWGYFFANGKGGKWRYNKTGAASRYVKPGGYEGWAFALNAKPGKRPKPRVRPVKP